MKKLFAAVGMVTVLSAPLSANVNRYEFGFDDILQMRQLPCAQMCVDVDLVLQHVGIFKKALKAQATTAELNGLVSFLYENMNEVKFANMINMWVNPEQYTSVKVNKSARILNSDDRLIRDALHVIYSLDGTIRSRMTPHKIYALVAGFGADCEYTLLGCTTCLREINPDTRYKGYDEAD